jgi:hypothetical protein
MTRLALTSIVIGVVIVASRLPGVIVPAKFREHALKFPRSVLWARVLMAIVAVWVGIVLYGAATEEWAWARPLIVVGIPVAYWVVIQFADQFLAVRAAAAFILLIAKVMVDAADLSDLPARLFVTVLAYVWVIMAIWIAIAPHHARDLAGYLMANDNRCRAACSVSIAVGVALVALGLFVY